MILIYFCDQLEQVQETLAKIAEINSALKAVQEQSENNQQAFQNYFSNKTDHIKNLLEISTVVDSHVDELNKLKKITDFANGAASRSLALFHEYQTTQQLTLTLMDRQQLINMLQESLNTSIIRANSIINDLDAQLANLSNNFSNLSSTSSVEKALLEKYIQDLQTALSSELTNASNVQAKMFELIKEYTAASIASGIVNDINQLGFTAQTFSPTQITGTTPYVKSFVDTTLGNDLNYLVQISPTDMALQIGQKIIAFSKDPSTSLFNTSGLITLNDKGVIVNTISASSYQNQIMLQDDSNINAAIRVSYDQQTNLMSATVLQANTIVYTLNVNPVTGFVSVINASGIPTVLSNAYVNTSSSSSSSSSSNSTSTSNQTPIKLSTISTSQSFSISTRYRTNVPLKIEMLTGDLKVSLGNDKSVIFVQGLDGNYYSNGFYVVDSINQNIGVLSGAFLDTSGKQITAFDTIPQGNGLPAVNNTQNEICVTIDNSKKEAFISFYRSDNSLINLQFKVNLSSGLITPNFPYGKFYSESNLGSTRPSSFSLNVCPNGITFQYGVRRFLFLVDPLSQNLPSKRFLMYPVQIDSGSSVTKLNTSGNSVVFPTNESSDGIGVYYNGGSSFTIRVFYPNNINVFAIFAIDLRNGLISKSTYRLDGTLISSLMLSPTGYDPLA